VIKTRFADTMGCIRQLDFYEFRNPKPCLLILRVTYFSAIGALGDHVMFIFKSAGESDPLLVVRFCDNKVIGYY
jgi:hypothetical protein